MLAVAGEFVGGIENILPKEAKHNAASIIPTVKTKGLDTVIPRARPMITTTSEMPRPKTKEASMSPRMMVSVLIGQDINRSSVLACASQGTTIGDIAVAVKKRIMPNKPGIIKSIVRFLPIVKERNRKIGKSTPKITTGPFE
jgi:hypothetical protein